MSATEDTDLAPATDRANDAVPAPGAPDSGRAPEAPAPPDTRAAPSWARVPGIALFAVTIFASAFLLFLVQPMVGKRILPWFGGAPAVWSVCLAFYQTTLFAGYAYAHLLVRFVPARFQLVLHTLAVGAAVFLLPVLPDASAPPAADGHPSTAILATLVRNVALPFLVLASTGPLAQAWFVRRYPETSPYPLYALSNAGSLLALLAYPFYFEPQLTLSSTGSVWSMAFAATGAAIIACAALAWRSSEGSGSRPEAGDAVKGASGESQQAGAAAAAARIALWLALPACAVVLLMGVTNRICLDIASVPFLWILPLMAYLVSLILCFGSERIYDRQSWIGLALLGGFAVYGKPLWLSILPGPLVAAASGTAGLIAPFLLLLFTFSTVLHGELFRLRPASSSLTAFYLCLSAGGALGGLFVGLGAPQLFAGYYELPLGVCLALALVLGALRLDPKSGLQAGTPPQRWAVPGVAALAVFAYLGSNVLASNPTVLHEERSFFGVLRVLRVGQDGIRQVRLRHGSTLHGAQIEEPRTLRDKPTFYYGVATGIGLMLQQRLPGVRLEVGVVGLGAGALAAYGERGDRFRFFEIDPAVVRLARDSGYFSFLSDSKATVDIVTGDGRLALEAEAAERNPRRYHFLVIDAFSSDAVPVHLLTREAFEIYRDALAPSGVLAVHVSNRHFDLRRIVARIAAESGMDALSVISARAPRHHSGVSQWMLLSRKSERLGVFVDAVDDQLAALGLREEHLKLQRFDPSALRSTPLWTDDYSDLFGALRRGRRGQARI